MGVVFLSGMLFPGALFVDVDGLFNNFSVGDLHFLLGQQSQGGTADDDQRAWNAGREIVEAGIGRIGE